MSAIRWLWGRWVLREAWQRLASVLAVALVVGLGSGVFATVQATTPWRLAAIDDSVEDLRMHDVRVALDRGTFLSRGELHRALVPLVRDGLIEHAVERLVVRVQVDASSEDRTVIVPGRIVAVLDELPATAPINTLEVRVGSADATADGFLEYHFARHYNLPPTGVVQTAGGHRFRYAGQVLSPEYFVVTGEEAGLLAESNFAVLFTDAAGAERIVGRYDETNELVVRFGKDIDRSMAIERLERALHTTLPGIPLEIVHRDAEPSLHFLVNDIRQDDELWSVIALLVLACAALSAGSLARRTVDAQRREMGVGMALGMRPRELAARPLSLAVLMGTFGAVAGVGIGLLGWSVLGKALQKLLPLPVWQQERPVAALAIGAAVGLLLPMVAAMYPVLRAVHRHPMELIRPQQGLKRSSGKSLSRVRLPGSVMRSIPLRNLMRTPLRTTLAITGVAASITAMVGTIGMLDSMVHTIAVGEQAVAGDTPERLRIELDSLIPAGGDDLALLLSQPGIAAASSGIRLDATATRGETRIPLIVQLQDLKGGIWAPATTPVDAPHEGLILSAKAARELGVQPGDMLTVEHSAGGISGGLRNVRLRVAAIHAIPMRFAAFLPLTQASALGVDGLRNFVEAQPAPGTDVDTLLRGLSAQPGVSTVQSVSAVAEIFRNFLGTVVGIFRIVQFGVLLLAGLVAFNTVRITMEERGREHATLLALGLRPRKLIRLLIAEHLTAGAIGTTLGALFGFLVVRWTVRDLLGDTLPEIDLLPFLAPSTLISAAFLGLGVVAAVLLATTRSFNRIDIPTTLRLVE